MFTDSKIAQLSENLIEKEQLFESSINGRETIFEKLSTPEIPEGSEWLGIMQNYRRDPPLILLDDQKYG